MQRGFLFFKLLLKMSLLTALLVLNQKQDNNNNQLKIIIKNILLSLFLIGDYCKRKSKMAT